MSDIQRFDSAADALEELVALEAFATLVKERQTTAREYLETLARKVSEQTGSTPSFKVKGVGQAYMTAPAESIVVTDDRAWVEWAQANHPERCSERRTINNARLSIACEAEPSLAEHLEALHVLEVETDVDPGLVADVAPSLKRTESGVLIDPATGEVLPLAVQSGRKPALTVRTDKPSVGRMVEQIRATFEPRALK